MTDSEVKSSTETGRTPSMAASLLVLGVMIVLILLSVASFGGTVADGPLQVSMTLATLFALSVAYYYNFRGSVISQAILDGVNGTIGTIFVVLAIGTVIGALYLCGSVAAFVYYGSALISPRFFFVTVFVLASILSRLLGSSLTTVGAVGIAFVGLASIMGVSPAIAAGAAVSGAIFGNKVAPISDTANLTVASVGGLTIGEHAKIVTRTAIPAWILSAGLFLVLGFFGASQSASADIGQVQNTIAQYYNVSLLAFIPVLLIFVLSMLRFSAFMSLMLSAIFAVILAAFTQHDLIVAAANDPSLSYLQAAFRGRHRRPGQRLFARQRRRRIGYALQRRRRRKHADDRLVGLGCGQLRRGDGLHRHAAAHHHARDQLDQRPGLAHSGDHADLHRHEPRHRRPLHEHCAHIEDVPPGIYEGTPEARAANGINGRLRDHRFPHHSLEPSRRDLCRDAGDRNVPVGALYVLCLPDPACDVCYGLLPLHAQRPALPW